MAMNHQLVTYSLNTTRNAKKEVLALLLKFYSILSPVSNCFENRFFKEVFVTWKLKTLFEATVFLEVSSNVRLKWLFRRRRSDVHFEG